MTMRMPMSVLRPNEMQISCRPYKARAHINKRFHFAASDGAARADLRADRPVSCICGLGGTFYNGSPTHYSALQLHIMCIMEFTCRE